MDAPRYDTDIDLSNRNNSHTLMVELVGGNKRVLDVGCATGYLARTLVGKGCTVSGFEADPAAAEEARPALEQLVVGDVERTDLAEAFGAGHFDVVVFGDVLEHLRDPLTVLRGAKTLLAPGGTVVASIPNIAHGSVRLALLHGRFDYQPLGLLDFSHLRFFTRASIETLFRDAGLVPLDVRRTTAGLFETPLGLVEDDFAPEMVEAVLAQPDALTYQFVLKAVIDDADAAIGQLQLREQAQRERISVLERDLAGERVLHREARARADDAEKRLADVEARLEGAVDDLAETRSQLEKVLTTRTMRWSSGARSVYGRVRRVVTSR
jgi:2-polyprenyl-3-methyl-5-hydroxy-6-metoxy-1,4-benzoquinol methylase